MVMGMVFGEPRMGLWHWRHASAVSARFRMSLIWLRMSSGIGVTSCVAVICLILSLMRSTIVGAPACKKIGVTDQTYYRWRAEYGGMRVDQAKRLKQLDKENSQLKKTTRRCAGLLVTDASQ